MVALIDTLRSTYFAMGDSFRRAQARALDAFGLGPQECEFQLIASGPHWRLRDYGGADSAQPLLIVPAPIKRAYIWDLTPSVSAVRYCLGQGLHVYLLEWLAPPRGAENAGLDQYAGQAILACVEIISNATSGKRPFLIGQSLGGTLAAMFCALEPSAAQGLVLLGAPLCFAPGSSRFRDALVEIVPLNSLERDAIAGSLVAQVSAVASPDTFLWARLKDWTLSLANPSALDIRLRVERWALDEVALPGALVNQMMDWLYREDRLCRGLLPISGKTVGPGDLHIPTLVIFNNDDEIAPLSSIVPFVERIPIDDKTIVECSGEIGVGLQHLAVLVGRRAYVETWPQIVSWLKSHS